MQDIIGNKKILNFFDNVIQHDTVSHAYCLVGPQHVGKRTVAEELARRMFGLDSRVHVKTSPDFHFVERILNEKTGKLRKDISIDQIRKLITALYQRPFIKDGYKIAIIDEAHAMSVGASNALLKTLEEPKKKTLLFLITHDESELLPTIQSRCQMIYFSLVPSLELEHIPEVTSDMIRQAHGRPGILYSWREDNKLYEDYLGEVDRFNNLFGKPLYEKIGDVEELFGDKSDHILARNRLQEVLDIWEITLHNNTKQKKTDTYTCYEVSKCIKKARNFLDKNIHPRLLIEHILLAMNH